MAGSKKTPRLYSFNGQARRHLISIATQSGTCMIWLADIECIELGEIHDTARVSYEARKGSGEVFCNDWPELRSQLEEAEKLDAAKTKAPAAKR